MSVRSFNDLIVWQKAMDLVVEIYSLVKLLPNDEIHALSDQMKRAALSIPTNIAEGQERNTSKDFVRFLYIAKGSKGELETHLMICTRLLFLTPPQIVIAQNLLQEIGKMLNSLIHKLNSSH